MNYSRPTLIYNWHKHREAEPKDYDFSVCREGKKKLHKSTYKHFGTCLDTDWSTTAKAQMSQHLLKKDYEAKETPKSMVQASCFQSLEFDREQGANLFYLAINQLNNEMELCTTYTLDYLPPHVNTKKAMSLKSETDRTVDFRRRQSHFTDVADHRRWGQNTWQDVNEPQARVRGVMKPIYRDVYSGFA